MNRARFFIICIMLLSLVVGLAGCKNSAKTEGEFTEEKLAIVVTESDISTLDSYKNLKELDLSGSTCYAAIEEYISAHPDVKVTYTVNISGQEVRSDVSELDLSGLEPSMVSETAERLKLLSNLTKVELMDSNGNSALSMDDVKTLKDSAPDAVFHYTFELFGKKISTTDETVEYVNVNIGNKGEQKIRQALDIMSNCTYFKLDDCGIDNEVMAKIRDDYPETKIVWRVWVDKKRSWLTDTDTVRAVYHVDDSNSSALQYFTEAKYIDLGHNSDMKDISFIASMPKLEIVILSGSPITDLSGFANCKNLEFLELAFCGRLKDISPLANCPNLKYLNISFTKVEDVSPLDNLPLERLSFLGSKLTAKEKEELQKKHPDCWLSFKGSQPYGKGWRYDDAGYTYSEIYKKVRKVFGYDDL